MRRALFCLLIVLVCPAGAAFAQAVQARGSDVGDARVGQKLRDEKGSALGEIEKVVSDANGRQRQVLVRVAGVLRPLPLDSLTRSGDAYVTVLSRAELEALPAAD